MPDDGVIAVLTASAAGVVTTGPPVNDEPASEPDDEEN